MSSNKKLLQGASGFINLSGSLNVEDVFSIDTFFNSNNSVDDAGRTITNGIDLAGEGGLVWVKSRTSAQDHSLTDTVRGASVRLSTNTTGANATGSKYDRVDQFNSDGFRYPNGFAAAQDYVAWTFRKAPKFFDVVSWSGNATAGRQISHSLGSVPGMVIVKNLTVSGNGWYIFHRSTGKAKYLLFTTDQALSSTTEWNNTDPTDTHFTVGSGGGVNGYGSNYVAYLFGHDTSDEGIIQCGNLTISSQASTNVALGFEPQWILLKHSSSTSYWWLFDTERGMTSSGFKWVYPNASDAEETKTYQGVFPISNGFTFNPANNGQFTDGDYIYIAIRKET